MIAVVNYGSQFTHLIARRLRGLNVRSEIVPSDVTAAKLKAMHPSGIVLSGGPTSVNSPDAPVSDPAILELGVPVLGICFGHQLMAKLLGCPVTTGQSGEYGKEVIHGSDSPLFTGLPREHVVWYSHGDEVKKLPEGFRVIGKTEHGPLAAMEHPAKKLYGLQFHPEVSHTEYGLSILQNFAIDICQDPADWTIQQARQTISSRLREEVVEGDVLVGVSGGVDSMVAATLLDDVVPERLHAVFVDTGLLRKDEAAEVKAVFRQHKFRDFRAVDASATFLERLRGVSDPEEKRRVIGHTFIEVFEAEAATISKEVPVAYLAQGTIYPDRIESAQPGGGSAKIKSHHNVTLPDKLGLKIVEPLKELYKDEVRELGLELRLPKHLIDRHPFPGPGLAIRVLGEVNPERVATLQAADAIYLQELRSAGLYDQIWQAFAALLPVQTVGVMGDARTYESMASLRAVTSVDGMTADWFKLPAEVLERISSRIVNEVDGINRVVYDVTQKPPGTIEYE